LRASTITPPGGLRNCSPGTGRRPVSLSSPFDRSVRPREQSAEESLRSAQTLVGQHHQLDASDRIRNQTLAVKTAERFPIEALPGPISFVERQLQKGEHRLIDTFLVDRHQRRLAYRAHSRRGHCRMSTEGRLARQQVSVREHGPAASLSSIQAPANPEELSAIANPGSSRCARYRGPHRPQQGMPIQAGDSSNIDRVVALMLSRLH
jgi:hypothetical protein